MSCDVRLETVSISPVIDSLLENLEITDQMKQHVRASKAMSVTVTTKPPTVMICLDAPGPIEKPALDMLTSALAETWDQPDPPRIVWDVHYNNGDLSPVQYLNEH